MTNAETSANATMASIDPMTDPRFKTKMDAESEIYRISRYLQGLSVMMQGQNEKQGEWVTLPQAVDSIGFVLGELADRMDAVLEMVQEMHV